MSLITRSDQRKSTATSADLLRIKVEQAATDYAIDMLAEPGINQPENEARKVFARLILDSPMTAVNQLMPYVTQNATVQADGGEALDSVIEFVVQAEAINVLYPPA